MTTFLAASSSSGWATLIIVGLLYFAPTLIAYNRRVPSRGSVAVVNVFLGWTLIGWVVALAMAARSVSAADRLAELEAEGRLQQLQQRFDAEWMDDSRR